MFLKLSQFFFHGRRIYSVFCLILIYYSDKSERFAAVYLNPSNYFYFAALICIRLIGDVNSCGVSTWRVLLIVG